VLRGRGGFLWGDDAIAQASKDNESRRKAAKYNMMFATEYKLEDYVKYPVMQAAFRENVWKASGEKMYVRLFSAGQLAVGAAFAQRIQASTVQRGAV